MKVFKNGVVIEIEDIDEPVVEPEPTPEERIAALEEELRVAKILLGVE